MITESRFRLFRGGAAAAILGVPCSCHMVNGKESELPRFFSSYPGGLPGLGLLLLRSAVGLTAALQGVIVLAKTDDAFFGARAIGVFALVGGTLFVFGLWARPIGPGAFSLDARLFGRQEITIPPRSR